MKPAPLPQLRGTLPAGINVRILTDRTVTIRASVKDVEFELMLTVALVEILRPPTGLRMTLGHLGRLQ